MGRRHLDGLIAAFDGQLAAANRTVDGLSGAASAALAKTKPAEACGSRTGDGREDSSRSWFFLYCGVRLPTCRLHGRLCNPTPLLHTFRQRFGMSLDLSDRLNNMVHREALRQEHGLRHGDCRRADLSVALQFVKALAIRLEPLGRPQTAEPARRSLRPKGRRNIARCRRRAQGIPSAASAAMNLCRGNP